MKSYLIVLIAFFSFNCLAQNKSGNVWVTGGGAMLISFTDTSKPSTSQIFPNFNGLSFARSSSTICDSSTGNLIFMCNGYVIYESSGVVIEKGDSLVPNKIYHHNAYPDGQATQGSLILPKGNNGFYYVFTPTITDSMYDYWINNPQYQKVPFDLLQYHIVDMNANGGMGKVVQKNIPLLTNVEMAKVGMMACRHANGYDWWLVKQGFDTNMVYTFLVTKDTVELKHTQGFAEPHFGNYDLFGQACFSTDGSKYAFATGGVSSNGSQLYIADFDRCTGLLSNPITINVPIDSTNYPFFDNQGKRDSAILGVCFSPNDSFLYINKYFNTYQYEYNNADSMQAWYLVHRYDTLAEYSLFGQLQKGIDGRIYMGKHSGYQLFNNVINKPNIKGAGCDFCQFCLDFSAFNGASTSPPNMPDFNLGALLPCYPLESSEVFVESSEMEVYPNPASTDINIDYNFDKNEIADLVIYDMLGREYIKAKLYGNVSHAKINTTQLMTGMYLYKISKKDKSNYTGKLIIE